MLSWILAMFMALAPLPQNGVTESQFDIRANPSLLLGKSQTTGSEYYDVIITRQPSSGVLVKLPYTRKGGKFTFDLHHRIAMTDDFGLPAEVTTVVEILTGGTNTLGSYTMADTINPGDKFDDTLIKASSSEIDRFVTPMHRKTITINTLPGPQSISVVGRMLIITRGDTTTRVDTPGIRIATVSNFKFEEISETNPLKPSDLND